MVSFAATSSLLLPLVCALLVTTGSLFIDGASIDDHLLKDPVTVQITSLGLGTDNFTDSTRNYLLEYQTGIYSFFKLSPMNQACSRYNFPISSFTRTTVDTPVRKTLWTFQIAFNDSFTDFHPYDEYGSFAVYCQRDTTTLECEKVDGGVLRLYIGDDPSQVRYQERQWLLYFDNILLACCDGTYQIDRQSCPDCAGKNYLPLILGCTLSFVGLILVLIAVKIGCRVQKRRRERKGIADAGHKAPPRNIGPAFEPHHHTSHHAAAAPAPMIMMRADHMGHQQVEPPVVVKVEEVKHHKKAAKEEPDHISTPEGDDGKHHHHSKHKHDQDETFDEKEKDKKIHKHHSDKVEKKK